eukprot:9246819-Alexandrium_andersonii.AAC.1
MTAKQTQAPTQSRVKRRTRAQHTRKHTHTHTHTHASHTQGVLSASAARMQADAKGVAVNVSADAQCARNS